MSKPIQAINRYKADLREFQFLLFEQFKLGDLLGKAPFEGWGEDEVKTSLAECYRWVREVIGPLNATGDQGCRLEGGKVSTPPGFKAAWKSLYEAGWKSIAVDAEFGGAGSPHSLQVMVEELISGANTAFAMYLPLRLRRLRSDRDVRDRRAEEALLASRWMYGGTWAGHDVPHGAARRERRRVGADDGEEERRRELPHRGDEDLHLRGRPRPDGEHRSLPHPCARRVWAPAGTKGLTLFIVPKLRTSPEGVLGESNDVATGNIEHKMGINGSSTCVLNFGENGKCLGWPVGGDAKLNQGMSQMFKMMNGARIAVGVQGLSVASSAFLNALEYAKDRKQGASIDHWKDATAPRARIIEHADIRRMLLDMKARVEGIRALAIKLTYHQDAVRAIAGKDEAKAAYHQGQVDLLVPLVKAYGSDQGFRVCETAIQTYGGAGYTKDYPVEQYCRDAKIFSIYEGTNHIQAMDLVGRKLGQAGGANLQAFLGDIEKFVAENGAHPKLGAAVKKLGAAQEALSGSAMRLLMWFQGGNIAMVPLYANRFLEMMSETAVAWMLLEGAVISDAKLAKLQPSDQDHAFYTGKLAAALYFARTVLPGVEQKAASMGDEDRSPLDLPEAAFATV